MSCIKTLCVAQMGRLMERDRGHANSIGGSLELECFLKVDNV